MTIFVILLNLLFIDTDSHEVTVGEFRKFVEATGYVTTADSLGWSGVGVTNEYFYIADCANWERPDGKDIAGSNFPVTQVSWYDAMAYCKWSGHELYSASEWKQAAVWENPNKSGKLLPNTKAWTGNVWEWVRDGSVVGGSFLCDVRCKGYEEGTSIHWPGKDAGLNNVGFRVKLK